MDWYDLFKRLSILIIQYLNMYFVFNGHKITVGAVFIFVGLVSLVMFILRRLTY